MNKRILGKTGFDISEISLGTWQLGGKWGDEFDSKLALETLETAYQNGINTFDTADIYQNGMSEKTIGEFIKNKNEKIYVITKVGRKLDPHIAEGYNDENIRKYVDECLANLGVKTLDLVLLHCPPTDVYRKGDAFKTLDALKKEGKISHYGVSVEKVEEALLAMNYDISAVEIIFNMFRLKPSEEFFQKAIENNIGIIVRVPLASGLLTGKFHKDSKFGENDHRAYNRNGEAFDKGETFSGVDYLTSIQAANEIKNFLKTENLAQSALRFILDFPAVSTVIPGASHPFQIANNVEASDLSPLSSEQMDFVKATYENKIKNLVHHLW